MVPLSALIGAALGYFILHPYTMFIYGLYERPHEELAEGFIPHVWFHVREALATFEPGMLHMGIPYAFLGGFAGLFFGLWLNARKQKVQSELRACAVDTLKTLMVTLSHYLLNAVTIIGGFAWRIQKNSPDDETLKHVMVIRKEAEQIEAVVKSLQSLHEVVTEHYSRDSEAMVIDLTEELKKKMEEQGRRTMDKPPTPE